MKADLRDAARYASQSLSDQGSHSDVIETLIVSGIRLNPFQIRVVIQTNDCAAYTVYTVSTPFRSG